MPEILHCPNQKLLTEPWGTIAKDILMPTGIKGFVSSVINMAKALGEINRYYSKDLPDKYLFVLQKRCTELRKIVRRVERDRALKGKKALIPWQHLEYLFSAGDRIKMKR